MPEYWIDIVERQKLRETTLAEIIKTLKKHNVKYKKDRDKKAIMQALESLVSYYATNS